MGENHYSLSGLTLVTPTEIARHAALVVARGGIVGLDAPAPGTTIDLRDHLAFPGLLNPHDHLFGTWWPKIAPNRPYDNVYDWLADYEQSPILMGRGQNSMADVYELGAYRNLISGVTTVADHYIRIAQPDFYTRLPIHVLYEYGRTWTPRKSTSWGSDIASEFRLAVDRGLPHIIHLAEGVGDGMDHEMETLLRAHALGRNTLIIHGISLRAQDMQAIAEKGASVCWCPGSNLYLYDQTADVPALLRAGVSVTLGTDSSMTGGLNLLDEMRIARQVYRDRFGQEPLSSWLVELVTTRAAYALMLDSRRGRLAPGYEADILVLPDSHDDPYTSLVEAEVGDIALLICAGRPIYGDPIYQSLFEQFGNAFSRAVVSGNEKLIVGDPVALLERLSDQAPSPVRFPFFPVEPPDEKETR